MKGGKHNKRCSPSTAPAWMNRKRKIRTERDKRSEQEMYRYIEKMYNGVTMHF